VLTLALGVGASVALFTVVNGVLLRPLPYGDPDRLVGAWHDLPPVSISHAPQTSATYVTYRQFARSLAGIALYEEGAVNVSEPAGGVAPQRLTSAAISASLIPVLQVAPALGRNFTELEDRPNGPGVVIISDGLWRGRFGSDPRVLGRTMSVNGVTREIVGVMPPRFQFPAAATQLWLPLAIDLVSANPGGFNYPAIARLAPGVSREEAERELASVLPRVVEVSPTVAPGVPTQMLLDQARPVPVLTPLHEDVTGDIARTLWLVAAAAGLVLVVATFNVANLILVRADARRREIAVREALGAGRARVLAHFLAESAVLATLAAAVGLAAAWIAVRALVAAGPAGIPRLTEVRVDAATVGFTALVTALLAVVCSMIPALRINRARLFTALREGGRGGMAGRAEHRTRGALVAAQIALALVVLAGSGLLLRTFQRLHAVRPGFDAEGVATLWMSLPEARYPDDSATTRFYAQLTNRVAQLPGVQSAGISSRLPLLRYGMNGIPLFAENDPNAETRIGALQILTTIDSAYLSTIGIPLLAGRPFRGFDTQRWDEAIVSQATAEQFWNDPTGARALGKRFRVVPGGPWYTVIGVAGNARDTSLASSPSQTVYFAQVPGGSVDYTLVQRTMALAVRSRGDPALAASQVQRVIRELDPALPTFDVQPMTAVLRESMGRLRFVMIVLGAAAAVTLLLGAVGLYGVMAYLVSLRTRELGVRLALGAQPRTVAAMLTKQGLTLAAIGLGAGLVVFALTTRFLRAFLYGVAPSDPLAIAGAMLIIVATATVASWLPARRAARVDPARALRAE
jgi:predicted permease